MFEQSLYNQEAFREVKSQEGELFHNYEIKNWDLSPRIYKILAVSAIANILTILLVGQTSLLTMKSCDSPFVNRICQVLDTVYVGSVLFGTDREYVDQAYEKTALADADIIWIDQTGETRPLEYPEGYFALANPEQYAMSQQQANNPNNGFLAPGIPNINPTISGGDLLSRKPIMPKTNPNSVVGQIPDSPLANSNTDDTTLADAKKDRHGSKTKLDDKSPAELPKPDDKTAETPAPTPITSDAVAAVEINKKPLADFADSVVTKWAANEIDLNQDFTVVLNGVLTKDGKLDRDKSKFDVTKQKGDPKMIDVAKAALEAVGDSGFLSYLSNLDVDKVTITLVQDENQITALISSGQKTAERAKTKSSQLNNAITIGKTILKNPSDERTLLDKANVTAEGTNFVVNFAIPKAVAQEIINRKLKEAQAKKAQQQQPNSTEITKPNQNTAK